MGGRVCKWLRGRLRCEKKKALCLIPVPTLPAVYCRLLSLRGSEAALGRAPAFRVAVGSFGGGRWQLNVCGARR